MHTTRRHIATSTGGSTHVLNINGDHHAHFQSLVAEKKALFSLHLLMHFTLKIGGSSFGACVWRRSHEDTEDLRNDFINEPWGTAVFVRLWFWRTSLLLNGDVGKGAGLNPSRRSYWLWRNSFMTWILHKWVLCKKELLSSAEAHVGFQQSEISINLTLTLYSAKGPFELWIFLWNLRMRVFLPRRFGQEEQSMH